jgi:hypothetical protein
MYRLRENIQNELPIQAMEVLGKLPHPALEPIRKGTKDIRKFQGKFRAAKNILNFFIHGKWIYKNDKIYDIINRLSDEEKLEFECDVQKLKYPKYMGDFPTGMAIWSLN